LFLNQACKKNSVKDKVWLKIKLKYHKL